MTMTREEVERMVLKTIATATRREEKTIMTDERIVDYCDSLELSEVVMSLYEQEISSDVGEIDYATCVQENLTIDNVIDRVFQLSQVA